MNALVFIPPTEANPDAWESLRNRNKGSIDITRVYSAQSAEQELDKALGTAGWASRNDLAKRPVPHRSPRPLSRRPGPQHCRPLVTAQPRTRSQGPFLGASIGSLSSLNSIDHVTKERFYLNVLSCGGGSKESWCPYCCSRRENYS